MRDLHDHFESVISEMDVRWDDVEMNQDVELEDGRSTDADVVLFNYEGMEVLSIEVKTSENAVGKAGRQMEKVEEFFQGKGYDVDTSCYVVERSDHMDHDDLVETVENHLGEPFSKRDLEKVIDYSRSWATFGCLHGQGVIVERDGGYVLNESAYDEFWGAASD